MLLLVLVLAQEKLHRAIEDRNDTIHQRDRLQAMVAEVLACTLDSLNETLVWGGRLSLCTVKGLAFLAFLYDLESFWLRDSLCKDCFVEENITLLLFCIHPLSRSSIDSF